MRESIGYWRGEIGAADQDAMNLRALPAVRQAGEIRTLLGRPPIVQGMPSRMGAGYEVATAVGLGSGAFGETGVQLVLAQAPLVHFRPRRLVIEFVEVGPAAPGLLLVTGLTSGNMPLLANQAALPVGAFAANSVGPMLVGIPLDPAIPIQLTLTRTAAPGTNCDVLVSACVFGEAI